MKLPVISGSEAVKVFRKIGYEFDQQHGTSFFDTPTRRTGASPFLTTKNSPKEPFGR